MRLIILFNISSSSIPRRSSTNQRRGNKFRYFWRHASRYFLFYFYTIYKHIPTPFVVDLKLKSLSTKYFDVNPYMILPTKHTFISPPRLWNLWYYIQVHSQLRPLLLKRILTIVWMFSPHNLENPTMKYILSPPSHLFSGFLSFFNFEVSTFSQVF